MVAKCAVGAAAHTTGKVVRVRSSRPGKVTSSNIIAAGMVRTARTVASRPWHREPVLLVLLLAIIIVRWAVEPGTAGVYQALARNGAGSGSAMFPSTLTRDGSAGC